MTLVDFLTVHDSCYEYSLYLLPYCVCVRESFLVNVYVDLRNSSTQALLRDYLSLYACDNCLVGGSGVLITKNAVGRMTLFGNIEALMCDFNFGRLAS